MIRVTPIGRTPFPLRVAGSVTEEWQAGAGPSLASIPCVLDDGQRERIRMAAVWDTDTAWRGVVWEVADRQLKCIGHHVWATLPRVWRDYMIDDMSRWEHMRDTSDSRFTAALYYDVWNIRAGHGLPASALACCIGVDVPPTASLRVTGTVARGDVTHMGIYLDYRDASTLAWTNAYNVAIGAGSSPTSVDQTITPGGGVLIDKVRFQHRSDYNWADETSLADYSSLVVYGVSGVTSPTAHNIIDEALDQLSTTGLPAGEAYRSLASPAGNLRVSTGPNGTPAEIIRSVCDQTAHDFGWYQGWASGLPTPIATYYDRSSTPDWVLDCATVDTSNLSGDDVESLDSAVRVTYRNSAGDTIVSDVSDTDTTHYLSVLGVTKRGPLDLGMSDSTTAATRATQHLADYGKDRVAGTIDGSSLRTIYGNPAHIRDIRTGQMIRLLRFRDKRYLDVFITRVRLVDYVKLELDVDANPYRLEELA